MGDGASLRQQSLELLDRALVATGTERLVLLSQVLELRGLARELDAAAEGSPLQARTPGAVGSRERVKAP